MPFGSLKVDPLAWKGKGELVKVFQDIHAFSDSLDLCKFSAFAEGTDEYAAQYQRDDGRPVHHGRCAQDRRAHLQPGALLQQPGRLRRRQRLPAQALHGRSRPPCPAPRVMSANWTEMLDEYYKARGWVNGVVPEAKLKELGIL